MSWPEPDSPDTRAGACLAPNTEGRDTRAAHCPAEFRGGSAGPANDPAAAHKCDPDSAGVPAGEAAGNAERHGTAERDEKVRSAEANCAVRGHTPQAAIRSPARQPKPRGATFPPCICPSSFPRSLMFKIPTNYSRFSSGPRPLSPWHWRLFQVDPAVAHCCPKSANRELRRLHGRVSQAAPSR